MKTCFIALSLFAASLVSAQIAATTPAPAPRPHRQPNANFEQNFEQRLSARLGLNATQQNALHTARMEAETQMQGMNTQRRTLHTALITAIKAGNTDQIDQVSQQMATLQQQEAAIRSKASAKIYATLSADQKTKLGDRVDMLGGPGGFGPGFGPGPGGPMRGRRPAPPAGAPAPQN